jgi:hypothetical protein
MRTIPGSNNKWHFRPCLAMIAKHMGSLPQGATPGTAGLDAFPGRGGTLFSKTGLNCLQTGPIV